jgi:hypothetical protein
MLNKMVWNISETDWGFSKPGIYALNRCTSEAGGMNTAPIARLAKTASPSRAEFRANG